MRWADLDFEQLTLRLPTTKAGRSHLLPLPLRAAEILRALSSRGQSEWVFPNKTGDAHTVEAAKAWQRIRARAEVPDVLDCTTCGARWGRGSRRRATACR
jgi:integrase